MAASFIGPFLQVGFLFAPEVIRPDFSKISPVKGFTRLFSRRALIEFAKGLMKLSLVGGVGYLMIKPYYAAMDHMVGLPLPLLLAETMTLTMRMMIGILVALAALTVVDVVYQRNEFYQRMRMTRQEVKDEYRQSEGDPHVKGRLRKLRQERARRRMMQAVPKADVVITNPTHYAVALAYKPEEMDAPVCIAKGLDNVALRIREIAKEHGVVTYENRPLARVLYDTVEIDEAVPPEHYKAVAEVISYVFRLKGRIK
jgi:flagellar biosynthetic protein FlhB